MSSKTIIALHDAPESKDKGNGKVQSEFDAEKKHPEDIIRPKLTGLQQAKINGLLYDAVRANNPIDVRRRYNQGAQINFSTSRGITPLMRASMLGSDEVLTLLIAYGAELDVRDLKGNTALHYAAHFGQAISVRILIVAGANIKAQNVQGQTPLQYVNEHILDIEQHMMMKDLHNHLYNEEALEACSETMGILKSFESQQK